MGCEGAGVQRFSPGLPSSSRDFHDPNPRHERKALNCKSPRRFASVRALRSSGQKRTRLGQERTLDRHPTVTRTRYALRLRVSVSAADDVLKCRLLWATSLAAVSSLMTKQFGTSGTASSCAWWN